MGIGEFEALRDEFLVRMERPLDGLEHLVELRATLVRVERLLVGEARRNYSSWEEIGLALGVSRQAAHRRHRLVVNRTHGAWHASGTVRRGDEQT